MSNKRIQRMAYGVSNKQMAQSTADAPNVGGIALGGLGVTTWV